MIPCASAAVADSPMSNPTDHPRCDLCGSPLGSELFHDRHPDDGPYRVCFCSTCRIALTVPRPSPEEMNRLYATDRYRTREGKRFVAPIERSVTLFNRLKSRIVTRRRKRGSILDIGCGRGLFLNIMAGEGWRTKGVEFNAETAAYASSVYGIDVITVPDLERIPDKEFDVITMYHVLEHVERPDALLDTCLRLLKDDGLLFVAVPNIASLQAVAGRSRWFHLDLPHHLYHFTTEGLLGLLRRKAFSIVALRHFDPEQNPYGWLQTLLNRSGIRKNFLYDVLKKRELRTVRDGAWPLRDALATVLLLPLYLPLSLVLSLFEAAVARRGGTIEVVAEKRPGATEGPAGRLS